MAVVLSGEDALFCNSSNKEGANLDLCYVVHGSSLLLKIAGGRGPNLVPRAFS